ncbi:MAG: LysR family transcriptional regulator, partial [Rhodoferax sp.]|nr:LysR family transcriptional regulator [Rhodoferax sp.]
PKVQIDLEERVSSVITRMVLDNAADIGIFASSEDEHLLEVFPYRADRMVLVAPVRHPLAAMRSVAFADSLDYDHIGMHRGSAGNYLLAKAASAAHRSLKMRFQVTSYDAMISMIKAGMGVGMMPVDAIALYVVQGLAIVDLSDDWAQRRLKLCVRAEQGLTTAGRLLLDHLKAASGDQTVAVCGPRSAAISSAE